MNQPMRHYPFDAFPPVARKAIEEIQANIMVPFSLVATSVLAAMSTASQERILVKLPVTGESRPVTVYVLVLAGSGDRKSAADNKVFPPIKLRDERREARWRGRLAVYMAERRVWEKVRDDLTKKIAQLALENQSTDELQARLIEHCKTEPSKPRLRTCLRQNASERAVLDDLDGRGNSLALLSDEGEYVLKSPLLSKSGLLNKAWDGGPILMHRAHGLSIRAQDVRMTISIMVQREALLEYLRKQGDAPRGTGFFARFLITWPQSMKGTRFTYGLEPTWERLKDFHARLEDVMGGVDGEDETLEPIVYELDDDARTYWVELVNGTEAMIQPSGYMSDISDFASKACEIAVRIAALFHHFEKRPGKISRYSLEQAARIVEHHIEEFKMVFSSQHQVPPIFANANTLEIYLRKLYHAGGGRAVQRNEVLKNGPVRPNRRFDPALQVLVSEQKVMITKDSQRRSWICFNPQYFNQFSVAS